ncbi:MAG: hydrogenase maturation nickel metallochaperone HypA [Chloroflexi bacterium]|nr:hydrogenase maturation nickel metallochaperone HypA [Chloroflexota bacterium]
MHELGVTQSLLDLAVRHAQQAGAARVTQLNVVIGQMANIVDDSVQFYWEIIAQDTIAAGAVLVFTRVPARLRCRDCGHQFAFDHREFVCPACHGEQIDVEGGDEFYLESIEVDLPADSIAQSDEEERSSHARN